MLRVNVSDEELRINKGITICFMCVADVTEIHHNTDPIESVNEIKDVDIEMNESATNEVAAKETLNPIPLNSSFMFHKIFTPNLKSHCWMQSCQMSPNNN